MNYLMAALEGPAANAISGLQITAATYNTAISLLRDRFGTDSALIEDHLKSLADVEPVKSSRQVPQLRSLYDSVQAHRRGLECLGVSIKSYSVMLYPILLRAIPTDLALQFKRVLGENTDTDQSTGDTDQSSPQDFHTKALSKLLTFLGNEITYREQVHHHTFQAPSGNGGLRFGFQSRFKQSSRDPLTTLQSTTRREKCIFCSSLAHLTSDCTVSKPLQDKKRMLAAERRCYRCTKPNHSAKLCRGTPKCKTCSGRHVSSMCDPSYRPRPNEATQTVNLKATVVPSKHRVLLQTATARCRGSTIALHARLVLDGGSQRTFISTGLSNALRCKHLHTETISIGSFGHAVSRPQPVNVVELHILGNSSIEAQTITALVVERICSQVLDAPSTEITEKMKTYGLVLADTTAPDDPAPISLLIGADHYWDFAIGRTHHLHQGVQAVETTLGWTLQGPYSPAYSVKTTSCHQIAVLNTVSQCSGELHTLLDRIWTLDSIGISATETQKDSHVLEEFEDSIKLENGQYVVSLPWRANVSMEPNRQTAERRLTQVTRRLLKSPDLAATYDTAIREYLLSGVAERVSHDAHKNDQAHIYYMPHHAVIREDRITTKVRIVFDASSHDDFTRSLNDNLDPGPNLNPSILSLLLNFRLHPIALVADVQKAFLQIAIRQEDRDALRFLWYSTPPTSDQPLPDVETWRMTRVTFGTAPSTFLLAATLRHHLRCVAEEHPAAVEQLTDAIYVDDVITGAVNEEDACQTCRELQDIFAKASMTLQKWGSNSAKLRDIFKNEPNAILINNTTKVLGVTWDQEKDVLSLPIKSLSQEHNQNPVSKRKALTLVAEIYDPLGLVIPCTVTGKILLQETWKRQLAWDDNLPEDLLTKWQAWHTDLQRLNDIQLPRCYTPGASITNGAELHFFSDASPLAYGTVAYMRIVNDTGIVTTHLLTSKSRLAPLKTWSSSKNLASTDFYGSWG
ncbi:uncharacterized protein LOC135375301 [Ornithodoros turicata]|uniref:uncharacterized protein LOC135375301 n=1 Tax=Ornithodoros turicata TaxID=34597 RepID=UPI0031398AAD